MIKKAIAILCMAMITACMPAISVYADNDVTSSNEDIWGVQTEATTKAAPEEESEEKILWDNELSPSNYNDDNYDNKEIRDGNAYKGAEWYYSIRGTLIRRGGRNSIDNNACKSREETEALEARIRTENYILVTTDNKDITDEEYEKYISSTTAPPYASEMSQSEFGWDMEMYKVYMYRPIFEQALKDIEEYDVIKSETLAEIYESTVIIDYGIWYMDEKIGKVDNEFNDNIPSFYSTGFMEITSPIACEVLILNSYEQGYYKFYVKANNPLLVKIKQGEYYFIEINGTGISLNEELLPHTGILWIRDENTEDNPFKVDLTGVIKKYSISPKDISMEQDYSWENKEEIKYEEIYEEIPIQEVEVEEKPAVANPDKYVHIKYYLKIVIIVSLATIILGIIIKVAFIKKNNEE